MTGNQGSSKGASMTEPVEIGESRAEGVVWFTVNPHGWPIGTKFFAHPAPAPADHPLFGKMEQLGQPFEKVLHDNLDALQETELKAKLAEAVGLLDECRPYLRDAALTYGNCGKEDVSELLDKIAKASEVMG